MMRFRKYDAHRLAPAEARRQGQITHLAFLLLGRERAMAFLNENNTRVGGRPLDLAIASEEGCVGIEAELGRLTCK